jgi:hypothetical protein
VRLAVATVSQDKRDSAEDAADTRTCGHSADDHGPYGCMVDGPTWSCWCGTPRHLLAIRRCEP